MALDPDDRFRRDQQWTVHIPPARRRRLHRDVRRAHAVASDHLRHIDVALEVLVQRRGACLDELAQHRAHLNRRYTDHHIRRPSRVDEPPVPPAPPRARALGGIDLRSVCVTILRRHGAQRLRDLHGLLHCYGYVVDGPRPVQRLADAMAYERSRGRVERIERGIYDATASDHGPTRLAAAPGPVDLGDPLPWDEPSTAPGPPLVDPPVAHDPEHWSRGAWPDPTPSPAPGPHVTEPAPDLADPPTTPPSSEVGTDSSTNRSLRPEPGEGESSPGAPAVEGAEEGSLPDDSTPEDPP